MAKVWGGHGACVSVELLPGHQVHPPDGVLVRRLFHANATFLQKFTMFYTVHQKINDDTSG